MRKFELLQQDMHQSNSDYLNKFLVSVDLIDSFGSTVGVHQSLVDAELAKVHTRYAASDYQSKHDIYAQCQMKASQQYLETCYMMGADRG